MRIAFRVDASLDIGTGHVFRCLSLARALSARGADILFVCRAHMGHQSNRITAAGFDVYLLPSHHEGSFDRSQNYQDWIGAPVMQDAKETIDALRAFSPDLLVVDHYGLDAEWEERVCRNGCAVLVVDDLANRSHACDYLLDQNFFADAGSRYESLVPPDCQLYLGPRYALLREEFAVARKASGHRPGKVIRVNVFVGGSDRANLTGRIVDVLSAPEFSALQVDVVLGANQEHADVVEALASRRQNTTIHRDLPHLADLLQSADLAIGAGGTTNWERFCVGLPALVASNAKNQEHICRELHQAGLINYIGPSEQIDNGTIGQSLRSLIASPERLEEQSRRGRLLVDGRGATRVAEILMPSNSTELEIRVANAEDVLQYFDWVNDPAVRSGALNSEEIMLSGHLEWFEERLKSGDSNMFVLEVNGLPIGQIRFDRRQDGIWIDYSLDRIVRGRGWGVEVVRRGLRFLPAISAAVLHAEVLPTNKPSLAVFRHLGFEETVTSSGTSVFSRTLH